MDMIADLLPVPLLIAAVSITLAAGFVKGAVGFAMPLIMISGMSLFLEPQVAVAAIILPIVMSNLLQTARAGWAPARAAVVDFRRYIAVVCVAILISAQFLTAIPAQAMYLVLGLPVTVVSIVQLAGWRFTVAPRHRAALDWAVGLVSGTLGGLSGTWGPPTVLYLLALDTPRARQMAVQGVVYGLGSVMLLIGHLQSGVLNRQTLPLSAFLLVPAGLGMWIGFGVGDRLNQAAFRRATLVVLVVAGLNLMRRGIFG